YSRREERLLLPSSSVTTTPAVDVLGVRSRNTLIPITSVQLGETVTFTCDLRKNSQFSRREVDWYTQSTGDSLKLIWTLKESAQPEFSAEFNQSRWKVNYNENSTNLTILRANQEDEGIYHCGITEWFKNTEWSGSYLLVRGNNAHNYYTVVQTPLTTVQEPGNSVTFQCSVFSDSDKKTCPGDLTVLWFRAGSHKSYPKLIYTDRHKSKECDKRSDPQKSCNYTFSKIVSSSDEGTYYCAVATCWELFFGNGTKLQTGRTLNNMTASFLCLSESLIISFLFFLEQKAGSEFTVLVIAIICFGHDLNYAALHFSGNKSARGRKKKNEVETEETVYSHIRSRV
uniref:Ig-like domain-containing protein n=1 Tax=Neolamprologus brichardi TaxID=32507 RepID=A0A3Q4H5L8_NEOBR